MPASSMERLLIKEVSKSEVHNWSSSFKELHEISLHGDVIWLD